MKYTDFTKEIQAKIDAFPFMFAFSNQQLEEGKQKLGVTDNSELLSIGAGGFIRKTDKQAYFDLMKSHDKSLTDFLKDPEQLKDAFKYELDNHEFCITWETEPALEALGIEDPRDLSEEQQKALVEALKEYKARLRELEEEAEEKESITC